MSVTRLKIFALLAAIAVPMATLGCGDDEVTFQNPATITVRNATLGKILRVFFKDCGSGSWGEDRLSDHPVEGVIEVNAEKNFTVEEGCYDLRADHLPGPDPAAQLVTQTLLDQVVTGAGITWQVEVDPGGMD